MYYLVHYCVKSYSSELIEMLSRLKIQYIIIPPHGGGNNGFVSFKIKENSSEFEIIRSKFPYVISSDTLYFPNYTEAERCAAKWLEFRAITAKIDPANDGDLTIQTCIFGHSRIGIRNIGHHRIQIKPVELKRSIRWGNSAFFSCSITTPGLFCDDRAVSIMEHAGLKGLQYGPVLKWRTGIPIPNVHQVLPNHVIPNGVFAPIRDMESYTCEMCGMQMLRISGKKFLYGIRDNFLNPEVDFYKTLPLFLDYSSKRYNGGKIHYIISQRAYQVLKKNRMCRGVEFTPLALIP